MIAEAEASCTPPAHIRIADPSAGDFPACPSCGSSPTDLTLRSLAKGTTNGRSRAQQLLLSIQSRLF